jgi:hypothetical protein
MANIAKSRFNGEYYEKPYFYFTDFPVINYDIDGSGDTIAIRNILKRFAFRTSIRDNSSSYSLWTIRDEDTPEVVAHRLYNSGHLYWVVLLFNQIFDPIFGWPLFDRELYNFCVSKYGIELVNGHHHYESDTPVADGDLPAGMVVDQRYFNKSSISNYQYEFRLNEKKRKIRLLKPEYLYVVLREWDKIKKSGFTVVT